MGRYILLENGHYWNRLWDSKRNNAMATKSATRHTGKLYRRTILVDTRNPFTSSRLVISDFDCDEENEKRKILTEQEV